MARLLATGITAFLAAAAPALAQTVTAGPFTVDTDRPQEVRLDGEIGPDAATELARLLRIRPSAQLLVIDSPGGDVREAIALATLVRDRGLSTIVPPDGRCLSACALVFLAGGERAALGRLGVNQTVGGPDLAEAQASLGAAIDFVAGLGLDPRVLTLILSIGPDSLHTVTRAELDELGIDAIGPRIAPAVAYAAAQVDPDAEAVRALFAQLREEGSAGRDDLDAFDLSDFPPAVRPAFAVLLFDILLSPEFAEYVIRSYRARGAALDLERNDFDDLLDGELIRELMMAGLRRLRADDTLDFFRLLAGMLDWAGGIDPALCADLLGAGDVDAGDLMLRWIGADPSAGAAFADFVARMMRAEIAEVTPPPLPPTQRLLAAEAALIEAGQQLILADQEMLAALRAAGAVERLPPALLCRFARLILVDAFDALPSDLRLDALVAARRNFGL